MHTIPDWLQTAFSDWLTGRLYVDGCGNYRSLVLGRCIVPYNRSLQRLYPDNQDFHRAAHLWLALWEAVPTARLRAERIRLIDAGVQS
jgi:hypothetical protein